MSRILLGVSGGIAAYKALELVRLATGAGHAVRVVQTPGEQAVRRSGVVRGADRSAGARQRVRARPRARGVPRPAAARARAAQPPGAGRQRRGLRDRAGVGEHDRQARGRPGGQPAEQLRAGRRLSAGGRAGDEQPHVRARRDAGEPRDAARARRCRSSSPTAGGWPPRASMASGAWPSRRASWRRARRRSPGCSGRRGPRRRRRTDASAGAWSGLRVLVTAGGTREPIDSVRFVGNSSSGRMGLALAQAARARGAEVTVIAANVALRPARRAWPGARSRRPPSCSGPARRSSPRCDVLLMAAAVADFRPREPGRGQDQEGRARAICGSSWSRPPT